MEQRNVTDSCQLLANCAFLIPSARLCNFYCMWFHSSYMTNARKTYIILCYAIWGEIKNGSFCVMSCQFVRHCSCVHQIQSNLAMSLGSSFIQWSSQCQCKHVGYFVGLYYFLGYHLTFVVRGGKILKDLQTNVGTWGKMYYLNKGVPMDGSFQSGNTSITD